MKFNAQSLTLFTKDMHAGAEYSCKLENGSSASFETKEFALEKIEKLTDSKFILKFNDEVSEELVKKIAVKGASFNALQLSQNSFELDLDKNISEPIFEFGENFESKFGAKLAGDGVVKFQ
ncbi:hypothetical protein VBZ67_07335 [Campylobacter concisus]